MLRFGAFFVQRFAAFLKGVFNFTLLFNEHAAVFLKGVFLATHYLFLRKAYTLGSGCAQCRMMHAVSIEKKREGQVMGAIQNFAYDF